MDVKPAPETGQPPVMDVVPPAAGSTAPVPKTETKPAPSKPPATGAPPNANVIAAIIATVLIVFGLAALAVYAYLKQNP